MELSDLFSPGLLAALAATPEEAAANPAAAPASPVPAAAEPPRAGELWTLPGFCPEARVMTSFGELPVKALRLRDPIRTIEGNFLPVKWIDRLHLEEEFLDGMPDAQPVRIAAGALGPERPRMDLMLSPHQQVASGDSQFRQEYRTARDLTGRPGILRKPEMLVSYTMFHLGQPATVMVEGVWVRTAP